MTRQKGTSRRDGTKVRTFSYACGSYIAKGTSACEYNPVGQEVLEQAVIGAVLRFYARYEGDEGRERLAQAVRTSLGIESADLRRANKRLADERRRCETKIARLLDTVTPATRDLVEQRLADLRRRRQLLETRHGELDRLASEQGRVQDAVHELARFLSGLEFALRHGVREEQPASLRSCIETVVVDKAASAAILSLRPLPSPGLSGTAVEPVQCRWARPPIAR